MMLFSLKPNLMFSFSIFVEGALGVNLSEENQRALFDEAR